MFKTEEQIESSKSTTIATYEAIGKCVHLIGVLKPVEQVQAYLQVIRELTLIIGDAITDNELEVDLD